MPQAKLNFDTLARASTFRHLCQLLCETIGIRLVFVDASTSRRDTLDYRTEQAPLCTYMRLEPAFAACCKRCDQCNLDQVAQGEDGHFYLCHAGLIDLVVPVRSEGRHVGTFIGGQMLPSPPTPERFKRFADNLKQYNFDRKQLRRLYFATAVISEHRQRHLVELISIIAAHISNLGELILEPGNPGDSPVKRAQAYIHAHLCQPFSMAEVARAAGVAPNYLSTLFQRDLQESFVAYVRRHRVHRAEQLLGESKLPLARIAAGAGFGTVRSMHRAFRCVTGTTPGQCR